MTGMTAWAGLNLVDVKAGDVIYISGAAGAVGNVAGQLAKLRRCRVIGSAGSDEKCGYCTPGLICSAVAMLSEIKAGIPSHVTADLMAIPTLTAGELRERMSGNLCRCGAYSNIAEAITEVAGRSA